MQLGEAVGYAVRFSDRSSPGTLVRLMTDGLLLAEIRRDRSLRRYDTIIVDEAHERSLNIDFLLGHLARILPRRPELKLIITSATIDPERFSRHFGGAPIVEVSGRTYPVEVRYRPLADPDDPDRDQTDAIGDAVDELLREPAGDVLVFLSGEREIRDTADALAGRLRPRRRHPAALRAALDARAAARVQAARRAPRRARHERRRDVADGAGHPLRGRSRHGADQPLQRAAEGPATADRADLAGLGGPAQGPLRPRRGRHLHPALRRGRLRRAPALHRAGDPAHEPRIRDPADGRGRPRRRRGLPVPRPARPPPGARRDPAAAGAGRARRLGAAHAARAPAGTAAGRPAAGPDGARGRPAGLRRRGDRDRRGALDPGPARAPGRQARGRPTGSTPASPTRSPTSSPT